MNLYRKKPVVIEAVQFRQTSSSNSGCFVDNSSEIAAFMGQGVSVAKTDDGRTCIEIPTLEGVMQANVGDWIIKGVNGEFYPCKPDIFEKTYDIAEESLPHQKRVVDEKAELDERREKLGAFKNSNMFHALPWQEQERLNAQAHLMTMLSAILGDRIANF